MPLLSTAFFLSTMIELMTLLLKESKISSQHFGEDKNINYPPSITVMVKKVAHDVIN